jgi:hypothetical protein
MRSLLRFICSSTFPGENDERLERLERFERLKRINVQLVTENVKAQFRLSSTFAALVF